ncbi:MAG: glutaredoxin 3 [Proteobacteria bacterium]|nr:glutaredoxin 3 [Pseudomonadota bacterium]
MNTSNKPVLMYSSSSCGFCGAARMLLTRKGVAFEDVLIDNNAEKRAEMLTRTNKTSVPQIFVRDQHVGGFDELNALNLSGELDTLLASE